MSNVIQLDSHKRITRLYDLIDYFQQDLVMHWGLSWEASWVDGMPEEDCGIDSMSASMVGDTIYFDLGVYHRGQLMGGIEITDVELDLFIDDMVKEIA